MNPPVRGQPSSIQRPIVVLLTDDADNRRKAAAEGIKSVSGTTKHSFDLFEN